MRSLLPSASAASAGGAPIRLPRSRFGLPVTTQDLGRVAVKAHVCDNDNDNDNDNDDKDTTRP